MFSKLKYYLLCIVAASCAAGASEGTDGVPATLRNPVLGGFHPDPSVVAVGGEYYLVNSSFHYFPGVPIYRSRDIQNWEQIGNVLDRPSQLPLKDATSWLGIYAPTIRYNDGIFYMITTNVGGGGNFMVTATNPAGPWSEPMYLEQQGIDPSLYFENGRCFMVSNPDGVITLCEIDPESGATLSQSKPLWRGTGGRFPEGPHIYRKDGWYYLLISEGGTEIAHKLTVARSRSIYGPYEANPSNPILTHCSAAGQESNIQGTGHGDMFQAADGSWWITFLAYRRFGGDFHHLGRETFIAPVSWSSDGWPIVNNGSPVEEQMQVILPSRPSEYRDGSRYYDFRGPLGPEWLHVQDVIQSNYSVGSDGLILRGTGKGLGWGSESPTAVLRRQEAPDCLFRTEVRIRGNGEAGLTIYQIFSGFATYTVRSYGGRSDAVVRFQIRGLDKEEAVVHLPSAKAELQVRAWGDHYEFLLDGQEIARLETALLSTEVVGGFTGVTVGPVAIDGTATFPFFEYREF